MGSPSDRFVIVGAGLSGLTAAAYLSRKGHPVTLLEKTARCGGLLNSFSREGFTFDTGARSIENAGVVKPLLKDLGIELELFDSPVTVGFESELLSFEEEEDLSEYISLLKRLFPDEEQHIQKISRKIKKVMRSMDAIYGFDNPVFKEDFTKDKRYLLTQILPWFGKFILAIRHMNVLDEPIESYLRRFTDDQALIDLIDQHFFKMTPTFFALGYFYVYRDYLYPKGGTGSLAKGLSEKILSQGGEIRTKTEVRGIDTQKKILIDQRENEIPYDRLIWGADLKLLYSLIDTESLPPAIKTDFTETKQRIFASRGGDSVFSVYLGVDLPPDYFSKISHGHFFYTPRKSGLGELHKSELQTILDNFNDTPKEDILSWVSTYCDLNTYEISIPSLRDPELSPVGKTGLIISILFEYDLVKKIAEARWYDEFKIAVEDQMITVLSNSVYQGLTDHILLRFSSTPLSYLKRYGCSEGGITGWTYERPVPVVDRLIQMPRSIKTPIPDILQVGQWAYSPAGIPTAILTGWYAADLILKS